MNKTNLVTGEWLLSKGFVENKDFWPKFQKDFVEFVEIPLKIGGSIIGFEFKYGAQSRYKYPLTESQATTLYEILSGKKL